MGFPLFRRFSSKILVSSFLFYSRSLTELLCSAFIAFISANIISVTDLFPTIGIEHRFCSFTEIFFAAYCTILNKKMFGVKYEVEKFNGDSGFSTC